MAEYLLTLAPGNPNGADWRAAVSLRTSGGRVILGAQILAVDPAWRPGVRVHVRCDLNPGETVVGISDGGGAAAGLLRAGAGAFWPVTIVTPL